MATAIPPITQHNRPDKYGKSAFQFNKEKDVYVCPQGKVLKRRCKNHRTNQVIYRVSKDECITCKVREKCIDSKRPIARQVTRYDGNQIEKARALCASPLGRRLMKERKTRMEGVIAQAKNVHGLSRARFRGKEKVEIQLLLTAAVINLKKLLDNMSTLQANNAVCGIKKLCRSFIGGLSEFFFDHFF